MKNTISTVDKIIEDTDSIIKEIIDNADKMICSGINSSGDIRKMRDNAIDDILEDANIKIKSLPDSEYSDALVLAFKKNAHDTDGVIYISDKDRQRIKNDFISRCNSCLKSGHMKWGGFISTLEDGFILSYGKLDEKCSVDSIFTVKSSRRRRAENSSLMTYIEK